ncbi:MAG: glycoside hydrolase family 5 protein [Flavobacteriales bacterium]|nr:glycoside hydrolase family 5 protein [Flavobacteriales bacterium]
MHIQSLFSTKTNAASVLWFVLLLFIAGCKKDNGPDVAGKQLYAIRGENPGIYDHQGRFMILRGANYNVLGDYWEGNANVPATKEYAATDMAMMAHYGFNCIRLIFSWSSLEPQPGQYDEGYIAQIRSVITEADKYGIYVMLDMHQDAWGKYIATHPDSSCTYPSKGWDGAPAWATLTDGATNCSVDGSRENAPAVYHAFQNFWDNTDGVQDACIAAWQHLVTAIAAYDNVLGYDLLNEPGLGYKVPVEQEMLKMSNYYATLITAIRNAEGSKNEHIIFVENAITWNGQGTLAGVPNPQFSAEDNLMLAPHSYFEAIGPSSATIEDGYLLYQFVSSNFQSKAFIGEWGFFGNPADDVEKVKRFAAIEDSYFGSSTWWQWCQAPGDPHGMSWDGATYDQTSMHLIELDASGNFTGNVNELYLNVLSRTRPNAIHGNPVALISNSNDGMMHFEAIATTEGVTELWISDRFGTPVVSGENVSLKELVPVDGGYLASVTVNGSYTIDVSF